MEASIAQLKTPEIPLSLLCLNSYNARKFENPSPERKAALDELAASIAAKGIIQPLLVRQVEGDKFEIIAGERRYRAAQIAAEAKGLSVDDFMVPVTLSESDDQDAYEKMLIENDQREGLTPFERAQSYQRYLDERGNTLDSLNFLSETTGVPVHAIRRSVALLSLPQAVLDKWQSGQISQGHVEQFTRLSGEETQLKALTACLQNNWTVKELRTAIENSSPALEIARFDQSECKTCQHNSSLMSSLFADGSEQGKCLAPKCFEKKQGEHFTNNWSKGKQLFGTNGFRFAHRLTAPEREVLAEDQKSAERCLSCPEFVSIVDLSGKVADGANRACVGAKKCFEELYLKVEKKPEEAPVAQPQEDTVDTDTASKKDCEQKKQGNAAKASSSLSEDEKAKRAQAKSQKRCLEAREAFYAEAIKERIDALDSNSAQVLRLALLCLALSSSEAKSCIKSKIGLDNYCRSEKKTIAEKLQQTPDDQLTQILQASLTEPLLKNDSWQGEAMPEVRRVVGSILGIDLQSEWTLSENYLKKLSQAEIVAFGEEDGVKLWEDEKVLAYKEKHYPKKGWMSLKKGEILDCILKSGADLKGKTPKEMLG
ncbi:ParB/RepB/Spo0J family partition protein [Geoalkalibacter subterraneus]|uniref:ParB-like N-terminal domain-containing protein n=1 Tax=Geoalkalibacter subterraneus TaxID=483547 RepID=A0A0B5FVW8_9BACT|nr:ParB/RepB/Spo0J family partition protein [Geoalkalibacter subterraneus]AJF08285.1 hypothetical protein GSUB_17570 [Geoalkalibacter subterraneus]